MMGAGGSADPFWDLYSIHKEEHVLRLLEQYRIGGYLVHGSAGH